MNSDIYDTGNVSNTQNPQGNAPAPGASDADDFQSTAGQDALNSQTGNLTVEETGDPITGTTADSAAGIPMGWAILIGVSVIIVIIVTYKMIKSMIEEDKALTKTSTKRATSTATTSSKSAAKKPSKKVSRTGKKKSKKRTTKRK